MNLNEACPKESLLITGARSAIKFTFGIIFFAALAPQSLFPIGRETCFSPKDALTTYSRAMEQYLEISKTSAETAETAETDETAKNNQKNEKAFGAKAQITKNNKYRIMNQMISCFDLDRFPVFYRREMGKETAYLLKEILDRSWNLDLKNTPGREYIKTNPDLDRWIIPNTSIELVKAAEGERKGQFLISYESILYMRGLYNSIKDEPYLEGLNGAGYIEPFYAQYFTGLAGIKFLSLHSWQWIGLIILLITGYIVRPLIRALLLWVEKAAHKAILKTELKKRTGLAAPLSYMALIGIYYLGVYALQIQGTALKIFMFCLQSGGSVYLVWFSFRLAEFIEDYLIENIKTSLELDEHMMQILIKVLKAFIVVVGILMAMQNIGINVVSLMAGLGLGGLALALAAKDTVANFFGSLMIMIDRPFKKGDWVVLSQGEGTVEEVGIRSTRIRTFSDSLISIPNSLMASEGIDNLGARKYRRVRIVIGVMYNTPAEKLEAFLEGIKKIIQANPNSKKNDFHVAFNNFGASSLDILIYFFMKVDDWSQELVHRQNVFLEILRLANEMGVEFAFPTTTVVMGKDKKASANMGAGEISKLKNKANDFGPQGKKSRPEGAGIFIPPYKEPHTDDF